ncbi:hypothetical protein [Streptomyces cinereospinus]|uniref:Uncharacterized protein n=1 Tax=Streptomyces cinereospinus TaxID=285561 RepID=A0ABV5N4C5_9ACTN
MAALGAAVGWQARRRRHD